jgi:hypothetical protein
MTWTRAQDRLPDDDITVLAFAEGDSEFWLLYVVTVDGTDGELLVEWRTVEGALATPDGSSGWGPVTHWMHLPEPPPQVSP